MQEFSFTAGVFCCCAFDCCGTVVEEWCLCRVPEAKYEAFFDVEVGEGCGAEFVA